MVEVCQYYSSSRVSIDPVGKTSYHLFIVISSKVPQMNGTALISNHHLHLINTVNRRYQYNRKPHHLTWFGWRHIHVQGSFIWKILWHWMFRTLQHGTNSIQFTNNQPPIQTEHLRSQIFAVLSSPPVNIHLPVFSNPMLMTFLLSPS